MARFNINNYEQVKDRIPLFYETHEDGRICTEVISETLDRVAIKAYLYKSLEEQVSCAPLSTGIAMENEVPPDEKGVHKYYENCETSAIGRALANLDMYNKNKDRASYEEMKAAELMDRSGGSQTSASKPSSPSKPDNQGGGNMTVRNPGELASDRQMYWVKLGIEYDMIENGTIQKDQAYDEEGNLIMTKGAANDLLNLYMDDIKAEKSLKSKGGLKDLTTPEEIEQGKRNLGLG